MCRRGRCALASASIRAMIFPCGERLFAPCRARSSTMRHLAAAVLFLLTIPPVRGAEEPRPNTLTPEEVAEGWELLFDGAKLRDLQVQGEHQIVDGILILGGESTSRLVTTRPLLRNFELRL